MGDTIDSCDTRLSMLPHNDTENNDFMLSSMVMVV